MATTKIFHSFTEMGEVLGIRKSEPKPEKVRRCRKCGATMNRVQGTNVYICTGIDEKSGKPFEHKAFSNIFRWS